MMLASCSCLAPSETLSLDLPEKEKNVIADVDLTCALSEVIDSKLPQSQQAGNSFQEVFKRKHVSDDTSSILT